MTLTPVKTVEGALRMAVASNAAVLVILQALNASSPSASTSFTLSTSF